MGRKASSLACGKLFPAGPFFVVNSKGQLLRQLALPSPGVPNFAFSPDEKTLYVTAVYQLNRPPYHGKVYAIPNR